MGKKAVHFGAGNIGRGFVAEFLHKSGFEVVFADVMETIINSLQASSHYTVTEISADGESTSKITNYRAINSKTNEADVVAEIATSDLVTCAVGPRILKFIAPVIAKGIQARSSTLAPLAVVACENAIGATDTLAEFILSEDNTPKDQLDAVKEKVRFGNSAIDRIVPAQDADAGLNVKIEKFYDWVIDRSNWKGEPHPEIVGVDFVDDLEPYIERKLYTVNTGHATAAYYGHNRGKRTIHDAMSDPDIHDRVRQALAATSHLIVNKHGITEEQQKAYVEKIITRISNPHLEDVVERVGRAPLRKLGPKERFIGPASQLVEMGHDANELMGPTEMAFRFQNVEGDEESEKLATIMKENSAEEVVKQVCELEPSHALFPRIVEIVKKVQADSK